MVIRQQRLAVNEAVVHARLDDEAVLLSVETGIYFGLDATGTEVWELLVQGVAEAEIFGLLLSEYEVEPAQLRSDLSAFLDLLMAKGLVRVVDA